MLSFSDKFDLQRGVYQIH